MVRLITLLSLLTLLLSVPAQATTPSPQIVSDGLLVVIAPQAIDHAQRVAGPALRIYHRLPDGWLAGTDTRTVGTLRRAGIEPEVVEEHAWSDSYAVVSALRAHAMLPYALASTVRVLRSREDHQLVAGNAALFEMLRSAGFVVVEIERETIPASAGKTLFSPSSLTTVDSSIAAIIALVSDSTVSEGILGLQNFGTRMWNNANRDSVGRWLRNRYSAVGVADVRLDSFQYSGTWQTNVVATIPGSGDLDAELIVGGHHDSYSSSPSAAPGADDNATGTVAALEMARVLTLAGYQPLLTLRFMGFAAEEAGLRGSASYAQRARAAGRTISAMLNYDMIGNRTQASPDRDVYTVWYTGAEALRDLHAAMMRAYTTITPVSTTGYRSGSDSYSFWQQNYPAVFCIERDFSPYYHSPNDLFQYLDIPYARDIIRSGLATLLTLDQMPPAVAGFRVRDYGNGTQVFAQWDSVSVPDFYRYRVYIGPASGVYTSQYDQIGRSRTFSGLTPGTPSFIAVSILDLAGHEGMISEQEVVPQVIPAPPVGVTAEHVGQNVRIAWRPNLEMDLRGYFVYKADPSPTFVRLNVDPVTDTTLTDAAQEGVYFVTAIDSTAHESATSDTIVVLPVGVPGPGPGTPLQFRLSANYPNPFNPATELRFEIAGREHVTLAVYDLLGREVGVLVDEVRDAGVHRVRWNAGEAASGVYIASLRAGGQRAAIRMMLVR